MTEKKRGFQPGNDLAKKNDDQKSTSTIIFRCTREEKGRWVAAANKQGIKLSELMTIAADALASEILK